jgi:hypothetical protein
MALHPSILFHFTPCFSSLKGILENSFKPSFAREIIRGKKKDDSAFEKDFAVPMVSFCDLRISELHEHIENYGHFGIGLTKDWALTQGLHPVFYINEKNRLIPDFLGALDTHFKRTRESTNMDDYREYNSFFRLQAFLKHYQGDLKRAGKTIQRDYLFADEREWRFVPEFEEVHSELAFVGSDVMKKVGWKDEWNIKIPDKYYLHFQPADVKYLIVENDDQALILIHFLKDVKQLKFDIKNDPISLLSSRILTCEQIWNDI